MVRVQHNKNAILNVDVASVLARLMFKSFEISIDKKYFVVNILTKLNMVPFARLFFLCEFVTCEWKLAAEGLEVG